MRDKRDKQLDNLSRAGNRTVNLSLVMLQRKREPRTVNKSAQESKARKELVLPLYFGWQIRVSLERIRDLKQHIVGPFKKYWQYMAAVSVLILIISTGLFLNKHSSTMAASYYFTQSDWSGGASTTTQAVHPGDQAGWDKYSTTSTGVLASSTITVKTQSAAPWTTTDDGIGDTGFNNAGAATSSVIIIGSGSAAIIRLATSSELLWNTQTLDSSGGSHTSLDAVDANTIFISYNSGGLKFASSTDGGNTWTYQTVDSGGGQVQYTSLDAVDANTIFISYYDATNDDLKFASSTDGGNTWTYQTLDSGDSVGAYTSLDAVDANTIFISYYDSPNSEFKLATSINGGADWTYQNVAYAGVWGRYTSISAVDANTIYMAYGKSNSYSLYLASSIDGGVNWIYSNMIIYNAHQFISIDVLGANNIYISAHNAIDDVLVFALSTDGGTTWSSQTLDSANNAGGYTSIRAIDSDNIFISYTYLSFNDLRFANTYRGFFASGTFISHPYDTEGAAGFDALAWNETVNEGVTDVTIKVRSGSAADMSDAPVWGSCGNISNGEDIDDGGCVNGGDKYVQFRATLTTSDQAQTPTLNDITINYSQYATSTQTLISSIYNTTDAANALGPISWTESLATGTNIRFRVRTSPDGSSWTAWLGPDGTGSDYFTDPSGGESIPAVFRDGLSDQYVQYQAYLNATASSGPTLYDMSFIYVVNATPEVGSVDIGSGLTATGSVMVNYEIRDPDTDTGPTPNQVYVTLEYCAANCSSPGAETWVVASTLAGDYATTTVATSTWSAYQLVWDAKTDYDNQYNGSDFLVRITANDAELANNIGYGASGVFTLDTVSPVLGAIPIIIRATTTPAALILDVSDSSNMDMRIGFLPDVSDGSWAAYNSTTSLALASDPDTVYAQFRDTYGNTTATTGAASIETPAFTMIQDISNVKFAPAEYRLFIAWRVVNDPPAGFSAYRVLRSDDGVNFTQIGGVNTRAINYYTDTSVSSGTLYYYRVALADNNGNTSFLSNSLNGNANGTQDAGEGGGGTPATPPVISNVATSSVFTTQAAVAWDTDKISNSTVGYSIGTTTFAAEQGVATMLDSAASLGRHSVTLTGLAPGADYYFQVKSIDIYGNIGTDDNNGIGYEFTTLAGPVISNVTAENVDNTEAAIVWNTDINSDSYVNYSTDSNMATSTQTGINDAVGSHSIALTGLATGVKYYYYVSSGVARDDNSGNYYTFTTTADTAAPLLSSIAAGPITDTEAIISWATDEPAASRVDYGLNTGIYSDFLSDSNLTTSHFLNPSALANNTVYYYIVASTDANSNTATSAEYSFTTLEELSEEREVAAREEAARQEGADSAPGGGGIIVIDKTDKKAPVISDIKVLSITSESAEVSWTTDEEADTFVEYGINIDYGNVYGVSRNNTSSHLITLKRLDPETIYYYRVTSADSWANLARSTSQTFTTLSRIEELKEELEAELGEKLTFEEVEALAREQEDEEISFAAAAEAANKAMDIFKKTASGVAVDALESSLYTQYNSLEELANLIPGPLLSGEPRVITTAYTATIAWQTDKEANSLVALAPDSEYDATSGTPYRQVIGNPAEKTVSHVVTIYDLEADTLYHYQVRSQAALGPLTASRDFTFKTQKENMEISSYAIERISDEEAVFRWVTNTEANSRLKYIPYRNNLLAVDEAIVKTGAGTTTIHEITVTNFEAGVVYDIELASQDSENNLATRKIEAFSTAADDRPPIIYQVQTRSALSAGEDIQVQTIISWYTNERATTRLYYDEGPGTVDQTLAQETKLDINYTKKHVVVLTKFAPGTIYRFQAESIDSGGNVSLSKAYTVLTPRERESVFQVIIQNFEALFGWVSAIRK